MSELPARPFPGIEPFSYEDREVFFARDEEARRLIRLIVLYRGVLLYAASGAGKSSLVNARLISLAIEEGYRPERLRVQPRPGEEILLEALPLPSFLGGDSGRRVFSVEALLARLETLRGGDRAVRPLLIFDQFEEWVTLFEQTVPGPAARESRQKILDALVSLIQDPELPVKVLIALREDYLARLEPLFVRCPALPDHYVRLTHLRSEQIERVVRGPFEKHPGAWPAEISPELAHEVRGQLESRRDAEGIPPTEVQIVCESLFEAGRQGRDPAAFFREQGGVQGLLERYLEASLESLAPALRDPAVGVLARMITPAGTRNVISREDLIGRVASEDRLAPEQVGEALDALEKETRLVRRELRREVYFYEIVSEFLVGWIRRKAVARRVERVERANRRLRWIATGLAAVALGIAALAAFAFFAWSQSEWQRQLRTSQLLVDRAEGAGDRDLPHNLLLAIEAVNRAGKSGWLRPWPSSGSEAAQASARAEEALRRVLARCRWVVPGGPGRPVLDLALSRDGRWLAGTGKGGAVYIWEATSRGLDREPITLSGLEGPMAAFDVSHDRRWAAVATGKGPAVLWNLGSPVSPKRLGEEPVLSVGFSTGSRWLISAGKDQVPRLWDLHAGAAAGQRAPCPQNATVHWQLSPRGRWLVTTCGDGSARLWDLAAEHPEAAVRGLRQHRTEISALLFNTDESRLATGDQTGSVCLWHLAAPEAPPQCTALALPSSEKVTTLCFRPDGLQLAAGGSKGTEIVWSFALPSPVVSRLSLQPGAVRRQSWTADGRWLLSQSDEGPALLRDLANEGSLSILQLSPQGIGEISPDSRWLLTSDRLGTLHRRPVQSEQGGGLVDHFYGQGSPLAGLTFSADRNWLLARGMAGPVRLWEVGAEQPAGMEPQVLAGSRYPVTSIAPVQGGRWLLASSSMALNLWSARSGIRGEQLLPPIETAGIQRIVSPGAEAPWFLTSGGQARIRLWQLGIAGGKPRLVVHSEEEPATHRASADGRWVVLVDAEGRLRLWDLATSPASGPRPLPFKIDRGSRLPAVGPGAAWLLSVQDDLASLWSRETVPAGPIRLPAHQGGLMVATFSHDGRWLITGDGKGTVRWWRLSQVQDRAIRKLPPEPTFTRSHRSEIRALAINREGDRLVSVDATGETAIWRQKEDRIEPLGHLQAGEVITSLAFSPDGRWLAMGNLDHSARLWDLDAAISAPPSRVLEGHTRAVQNLAFDPSGRFLFTSSADGTVRRWSLRLDDLSDLACRMAGRNLTRDEWSQNLGNEAYRPTCPDFPAM